MATWAILCHTADAERNIMGQLNFHVLLLRIYTLVGAFNGNLTARVMPG